MSDSLSPLARLRQRIAGLSAGPLANHGISHSTCADLAHADPEGRDGTSSRFGFGAAGVDLRLGGGLARAALHEVQGRHTASLAGFALMLAARATGEGAQPLLWISTDAHSRMEGALYGPGLAELGVDPARLILIHAPDDLAALRVAADCVACFEVGGVILEAGKAKRLDLTASRRLQLAAARTGVTCLVLRDAETSLASAASTRWQVGPVASLPLPGEAPGHAALRVELLRHRGGIPPFAIDLEWNRDEQAFVDAEQLAGRNATQRPPDHRALLPAAERRPLAA